MRNPVNIVFGVARRVIDIVTPGSSNGGQTSARGPAPVTPPPKLREFGRRAQDTAHRVADVTTDVMSTTATAVRERAAETIGAVGERGEEAAAATDTRPEPDAVSEAAESATQAVEPEPDTPGQGVPYEQWTKAQLYERAQELEVPGRSQMSKGELVAALRQAG
jgi:hypothetical protein